MYYTRVVIEWKYSSVKRSRIKKNKLQFFVEDINKIREV